MYELHFAGTPSRASPRAGCVRRLEGSEGSPPSRETARRSGCLERCLLCGCFGGRGASGRGRNRKKKGGENRMRRARLQSGSLLCPEAPRSLLGEANRHSVALRCTAITCDEYPVPRGAPQWCVSLPERCTALRCSHFADVGELPFYSVALRCVVLL